MWTIGIVTVLSSGAILASSLGRVRLVGTEFFPDQDDENLTLAEKQNAAGVAMPLDVSDAQLALSNAWTTDVQAQYDAISFLAKLQKAMGVLTFVE